MLVKRILDVLLSGLAILFFFPLGVLIIIILRFTGEGCVFYRQDRVGKNGKIFGLLKFVTMLKNSPNIGTGLLTTKGDARVLPFGKILRKTKLNEIPQLVNVLNGEMSIVGPRPQAKPHFDVFPEHVKRELIKVKPGLSGIGSIVFRDEEDIMQRSKKDKTKFYEEDIAPYKGELEIWYINNQSLSLDVKLIFITIWVLIFNKSSIYRKILKGIPVNTNSNLTL